MRPPHSPLRFAPGCIVTLVALWTGLMIASAGIAVYPPVARLATPFLCRGEALFESRDASYRPGEHIVTREIWCAAPDGKAREEITFQAAGLSFVLYSILAWLLLRFVAVPLIRRRALARHAAGRGAPGREP